MNIKYTEAYIFFLELIKKYMPTRTLDKIEVFYETYTDVAPLAQDNDALWFCKVMIDDGVLVDVTTPPIGVSSSGGAMTIKGRSSENHFFYTLTPASGGQCYVYGLKAFFVPLPGGH